MKLRPAIAYSIIDAEIMSGISLERKICRPYDAEMAGLKVAISQALVPS